MTCSFFHYNYVIFCYGLVRVSILLYGKHLFWRIVQSNWSIWGPDFAVMPSAAVAGHYEIFNALQNKTEQNSENTRLF